MTLRRWILVSAVACAFAGAGINFAIAWMCSAGSWATPGALFQSTAPHPMVPSTLGQVLRSAQPADGSDMWQWKERGTGWLVEATHLEAPRVFRIRSGLPLPALEGYLWIEYLAGVPPPRLFQSRASCVRLGPPAPASVFQGFPVGIVPLGFVVNTAVYGGGLFAIGSAVAALRWRMRERAGVCRTCGYDLCGLATPTCPECGATAAPSPSVNSAHA